MFSTVVVWVKLMMAQSIVLGKVLCYTLYVLQGLSWQTRFLKLTMMGESKILLEGDFDIMRLDVFCYYNHFTFVFLLSLGKVNC